MLVKNRQTSLSFSEYNQLYDILVPEDNKYRIILENVDFSFIVDELESKYSIDNGRNAIDPVLLVKYLMVKDFEHLSDVDVVKHSQYDLAIKYFLGLDVEETDLINPSTLTKFRKLRLQDVNILDILLKQTTQLGIEKGVIKDVHKLIVDATHTKARYNAISPREMLMTRSKELRKVVYSIDPTMKDKFPKKKEKTGMLEDMVNYVKELIEVIDKDSRFQAIETVQERKRYLEEGLEDVEKHLEISYDEDAKTGHKTTDTNFFGYKTHLGVTQEGIAVSAVITSGEKTDGKYLEELISKAEESGMDVKEVIGDKAYSSKENIDLMKEKEIKLISRLSSSVINGNRKENHGFEFNKDAQMYQCKEGVLAIRKAKTGGKGEECITYYFDTNICKRCPSREGCFKTGQKTKTFSEKIKDPSHLEQMKFEETEEFQEKIKERYVVEQTNSNLKTNHEYDTAQSKGIEGMEIQGAIALFCMNLKKILYPCPHRDRKKEKAKIENNEEMIKNKEKRELK